MKSVTILSFLLIAAFLLPADLIYAQDNDYVSKIKQGIAAQDEGNNKAALKFFKDAVKSNPDCPTAHFFLGRLFFLTQKSDEAVAELDLFVEKMKAIPNLDEEGRCSYIKKLHYLSEVYFTLKEYERTKEVIDEILRLDPKDQYAYYNLGVYDYIYEHSRSKAYRAFTKAIEIDSSSDIARSSKYAIEFIRNNPDSRVTPDFSFINQEYRD